MARMDISGFVVRWAGMSRKLMQSDVTCLRIRATAGDLHAPLDESQSLEHYSSSAAQVCVHAVGDRLGISMANMAYRRSSVDYMSALIAGTTRGYWLYFNG